MAKAQGELDRFTEASLILKITELFERDTTIRGTERQRFISHIRFGMCDCWYWVGYRDHLGYGRFNGELESKAHRASWRIFVGEIPDGMNVLHRCDVRCCVNPDHLFLGSQSDNVRDMVAKGRNRCSPQFGEHNPMAVLSVDSVNNMRRRRTESGDSYKRIAQDFGVSTMTAFRAITGQSWNKQ